MLKCPAVRRFAVKADFLALCCKIFQYQLLIVSMINRFAALNAKFFAVKSERRLAVRQVIRRQFSRLQRRQIV